MYLQNELIIYVNQECLWIDLKLQNILCFYILWYNFLKIASLVKTFEWKSLRPTYYFYTSVNQSLPFLHSPLIPFISFFRSTLLHLFWVSHTVAHILKACYTPQLSIYQCCALNIFSFFAFFHPLLFNTHSWYPYSFVRVTTNILPILFLFVLHSILFVILLHIHSLFQYHQHIQQTSHLLVYSLCL